MNLALTRESLFRIFFIPSFFSLCFFSSTFFCSFSYSLLFHVIYLTFCWIFLIGNWLSVRFLSEQGNREQKGTKRGVHYNAMCALHARSSFCFPVCYWCLLSTFRQHPVPASHSEDTNIAEYSYCHHSTRSADRTSPFPLLSQPPSKRILLQRPGN